MMPSIPAGIPLKIPVFSTRYLSRRGSEGQRLLCRKPKPKAEADNTDEEIITESNILMIFFSHFYFHSGLHQF